MRLRRKFTRPKPEPVGEQVVDVTDQVVDLREEVVRPRGPMQQWSRRPPEPAMAAAAAVSSQEGPAWAPASWRDESEAMELEPVFREPSALEPVPREPSAEERSVAASSAR